MKPGYVGQRLVDLNRELYQLFESLLDKIRKEYGPNDKARIYIEAENFHKNLVIHLRDIKDMTADTIMDRLSKITQSDEELPLADSFQVHVGVQQRLELRGTNGMGRFFHNLDPGDDYNCVFRRKCVVRLRNTDNLCVARSLCIISAKEKDGPEYKNLIHPLNVDSMGPNGLKRKALDLQRKAGLEDDQAVTFSDIWRFEEALNVQVLVVDAHLAFSIVYPGHCERDTKYFLFKLGNHVHPVVNLRAFWNKGGYCTSCCTAYIPSKPHRCLPFITLFLHYGFSCTLCGLLLIRVLFFKFNRCHKACAVCMGSNCPPTQASVECEDCGRLCRSNTCLKRHKESQGIYKSGPKKGKNKPSPCETRWRCGNCCKTFLTSIMAKDTHDCNKFTCQQCHNYVDRGN